MPQDDRLTDPFAELDAVAQAPVLLVASDFDGTLAPIVPDPTRAFPQRESMVALKALAGMANTAVALISGRALSDLATLTGSPNGIHLVGSHGSEFEPGFAASLPQESWDLVEGIIAELNEITGSTPGVLLERKPAGVAVHYRKVFILRRSSGSLRPAPRRAFRSRSTRSSRPRARRSLWTCTSTTTTRSPLRTPATSSSIPTRNDDGSAGGADHDAASSWLLGRKAANITWGMLAPPAVLAGCPILCESKGWGKCSSRK